MAQGLLLHTSLTELHEDSGLLGTQSTDAFDLARGSDTTGLTMGFDLTLPDNMLLTASGTMARTTTPDGQALRVTSGGLWSSAEEIALTKANLFVDQDRMRISFAKSMQADAGGIVYSTYGVVNRQTGQLGVINETVDPSAGRTPLSAEALYGRLLVEQDGRHLVLRPRRDEQRRSCHRKFFRLRRGRQIQPRFLGVPSPGTHGFTRA